MIITLKKVLTLFGVFVGSLIIVGLLLPSHVHVERSTSIKAPRNAVFARINDFREFNKWSPWADIDPHTTFRFEGPTSGVGARMVWASENPGVGSGSQEIILSQPDQQVKVALNFGDHEGTATYTLHTEGDSTLITWGFDTDFGYDLVGRYFGLMMDRVIGADYVKGLANLTQLIENQARASP
jgi:hypothetical protein